ncbi:MAG: hypothetical protein PSU94_04645 [Lacunisphaera sp.]|nr:hypothetical protein [Lacunisphaera sp.]
MRLLPNFTLRSSVAAQFAPADRFFLRFVPLAPDLPALAQAELALEGLAPFPPAQLYWGCCVSPDRTSALVYAAHRRRFTPEETTAWETAALAVPDLLPLLGAPTSGYGLLIHAGETRLGGAAWTAGAAWPAAVHARDYGAAPTEDNRRAFAAELAAKARLADAPARFVTGTPRARREGDKLIFELADAAGAVVAATTVALADQDALDVRDRAFLDRRRRDRRRGEFIWRLFLAGGAAAALALLLELGAVTFGLLDRALHGRIAAQAPGVEKLETAHGLTSRIDELTHRRLHFFEMLAAINAPRPKSISFNRTGTSGRNTLEIEAQTGSADDVGLYETTLRAMAVLDRVEIRDLRARDGVTTFVLTVAFKPETNAGTGGAP